MNDCWTIHGLCNRLNGVAHGLIEWPEGFRLHWPVNNHCPITFEDLFMPFPGVEVDRDEPLNSKSRCTATEYRSHILWTRKPRKVIEEAYWRIFYHMKVKPTDLPDDPAGWHVLHLRRYHSETKAILRTEIGKAVAKLGYRKLLVLSDAPVQRKMEEMLRGQTEALVIRDGRASRDLDRSEKSVKAFAADWKLASTCAGGLAMVWNTTVLDALKVFTGNVYYYSPIKSGPRPLPWYPGNGSWRQNEDAIEELTCGGIDLLH